MCQLQALQVQRYKNAKYRLQTSQSVAEANCVLVCESCARATRTSWHHPARAARPRRAWAGSGVSGVLSFEVPESVVLLSVPAGWVETDNDARTNGGLNSLSRF